MLKPDQIGYRPPDRLLPQGFHHERRHSHLQGEQCFHPSVAHAACFPCFCCLNECSFFLICFNHMVLHVCKSTYMLGCIVGYCFLFVAWCLEGVVEQFLQCHFDRFKPQNPTYDKLRAAILSRHATHQANLWCCWPAWHWFFSLSITRSGAVNVDSHGATN